MLLKAILLFSFLSGHIQAGDERGNGGGFVHLDQLNNTWFQEKDRRIQYCVKAKGFFQSEDTLQDIVAKSLEIWTEYLRPFVASNPLFKDNGMSLAFDLVEKCNSKTDLKFYFGYQDTFVKNILKGRHSRSVSFAENTSLGASWNQGVIFVRSENDRSPNVRVPYWSQSDALTTMVLHELGHIFGIDHLPGTVMREDIVNLIEKSSRSFDDLRKIMTINHEYTIEGNKSIHEVAIQDKKIIRFEGNGVINFSDNLNRIGTFTPQGDPSEFNEGSESIVFSSRTINNRNESSMSYVLNRKCVGRSYHDYNLRCLFPRHERFTQNGIYQKASLSYPAIYKKNVDSKAHQLFVFDGQKWSLEF